MSDVPNPENPPDGIHGMLPRAQMAPAVRKMRDFYALKPGAPFYRREFGYYCLERWFNEGLPKKDLDLNKFFDYDPPAARWIAGEAGWCEAPFHPWFETKVIEDRGEYELVQDHAGREVLFFKGRRIGFMPTYEKAPVVDWKSWEEKCKWRLDPDTPSRRADMDKKMEPVVADARKGLVIDECVIGGYMYLRSLMGPEGVMYKILEEPDLVRDCMETWLRLMDSIVARHQEYVSFDVLFFAEDICYNHGLLVSPDLVRGFLFPYYQQLIANVRARQIDKKRHLFVQVDTDGNCDAFIPLYREIGMDSLLPFEVAAGCDVVEIGRKYPDLVMSGGIDKRVLAEGPDAIDRHLKYILPAMRARGGYTPTCDHGVPMEVSLANYQHYLKRCREYGD